MPTKKRKEPRKHLSEPKSRWTRTDVLTALGALIALVACVAAILSIPRDVLDALRPHRIVVVGSMDFPEQYIVGEMIALALEGKGIKIERNFKQPGDLLREAIGKGGVDCYLEYTGALYTYHHSTTLMDQPAPTARDIYEHLRDIYRKKGVKISKPFVFQNEWVILVRAEDAVANHLKNISDLRNLDHALVAGFLPDFNGDPNGAKILTARYHILFKETRLFSLPEIYKALEKRWVDLISGNGTDPELLENNFLRLEDDANYFLPYQPVILVREDALSTVPELQAVIDEIPKKLDLDNIRRLNSHVRANPSSYSEVVRAWVKLNGL